MLISNALSRINLCHQWTWLLKPLTAEVPIFLLLQMIIFLPHSPESKVMHCCAWKAISEVLQKSCKAINMSVELESANTIRGNTQMIRRSFFFTFTCSNKGFKETDDLLFISLFLTYRFWSNFEIMLKCSKNREGENNNLFFYPQKLWFWVLFIQLKVQISTFSILIMNSGTYVPCSQNCLLILFFFWSYNMTKEVKRRHTTYTSTCCTNHSCCFHQ